MKYMGSKLRLAKKILPIILEGRVENQWYVEPFAGGMNSMQFVTGSRIANDSNSYIMALWNEMINNNWIPRKFTKNEYLHIKHNRYYYDKHIVGWAGFNCSFSGSWFGGFSGTSNAKNNTVRDYQDEAIRNVTKQVEKLKGVVLLNKSYDEIDIPENSIVYCDPPYANTTGYDEEFDTLKFWDWVRKISKEGHKVFVSEYNAPNDFKCVYQQELKSSLSANDKKGGSKTSLEKLFTMI